MISWHIVDSATYKAGVKIEEDLYFLSDTKEIYRGSAPFTEAVHMYTTTPPATGIAVNRLYIDSATLEGKIHDGTSWHTVIRPVKDTVTADDTNPVNSAAVIAYVASQLQQFTGSANVVSSLAWDSDEHILTATKGDSSTQQIVFDGLGVSLSYTTTTGGLQLLDASGNKIGDEILLPKEQFVQSGEYNPDTKKIILYFDAEKQNKVEIDATGLVDVYTGGNTNGATISVSGNQITATIKISAENGNILELKSDGLYVNTPDLSGKMDKDTDAVDGNIAIFDDSGNVVDSGKNFNDLATGSSIYQGTTTVDDAVGENTPKKGDFCVITKAINGDLSEKTAYWYDGENWVAFDGNYNAENVYFAQDLVTTSAIGNITLTNGQATIPAAGKNLKQVFDAIFVQEKNPTITQPSVSISCPQAGNHEVGSTVTPSYTANLNVGSYQYGPATGITADSWSVQNTNGNQLTTNTGTFDAIQVTDDTDYSITATASYGDGAIPKTNVGNNYAAGQIKAGSKSATSGHIRGFRAGFYGTLTSKDGAIDSALVRSLGNKTNAAPAQNNVWNISIPVGATRIVFAYPAFLRDVSSVQDSNGMNAEVKTAFTKYDVTVEGADSYTGIAYKVYVCDMADPNDTTNTYKVTI